MKTPLLGIRIIHSEVPGVREGHRFDTIRDFDATLAAARRAASSGQVAFVIAWKNRATFHGVYHLERQEDLVEQVASVCRVALREPDLAVLLPGIRWTLGRLFEAALAERLCSVSRARRAEEGMCRIVAA